MTRKLFMLIATTLFASCLLGLVGCGEAPTMEPTKGSVANESAQSLPLRVTFVDVGKGDCTLIKSGGEAVLIDTGYQNTADDVLAHLKKAGVSRLDAMIITHYDRDHIGGIRTIGEGVDVGAIYLPGYEGGDKNYRSCIKTVKELGVPTQLVTEELSLN
ncbi:MAG: MBL fold metallo-hydrolase, partial [Atopobiaceae bacterium]|nr:MBL fold metallo-hydrolase [Atopobiaceae bacterium]